MREKSEFKTNDLNVEKLTGKCLDKYFYPKTTGFIRVQQGCGVLTDEEVKTLQLQGIDTIFTFNDIICKCDEKVAAQYINRPLDSFSFELAFIDMLNKIHKGWLFDESKLNNVFLVVWINKAKISDTMLVNGRVVDLIESEDDIEEFEIALFFKSDLIKYFKNKGWNEKQLLSKADAIRFDFNNEEEMGNLKRDGLKFSKSFSLKEKPVNILSPRCVLREIAFHNEIITTT